MNNESKFLAGLRVTLMLERLQLDAIFKDLEGSWVDHPDYEHLVRDAHLGIAYFDAGKELVDIDQRIVDLINKFK